MAEDSPLKARLREYADSKGMNITQFERQCGLPLTTIHKMAGELRSSNLGKISKTFPDLDMHWLLTGEENPYLRELKEKLERYESGAEEDEKIKLLASRVEAQDKEIDSLKKFIQTLTQSITTLLR